MAKVAVPPVAPAPLECPAPPPAPLLPDPHTRTVAKRTEASATAPPAGQPHESQAQGDASKGPLASGTAFADPGPSVPDQLRWASSHTHSLLL